MVCNADFLEKTVEFFIFTTPVSLHSNDFVIKLSFNKLLEVKKHLINIRTFFKQINPRELAEIINEAYIISVLANRGWGRTSYIRENLL